VSFNLVTVKLFGAVTESAAGPFKSIPPAVNFYAPPPSQLPVALCNANVPSAFIPI
jgi:hypothetical protein